MTTKTFTSGDLVEHLDAVTMSGVYWKTGRTLKETFPAGSRTRVTASIPCMGRVEVGYGPWLRAYVHPSDIALIGRCAEQLPQQEGGSNE